MHLDRGLGSLSRHHPAEAVRSLQKALDSCPPSKSRDLYRICFYLGIALHRLGFSHSAIKSWVSCQRLNKRGYTRKLLSRFTNCYGMERQVSVEGDDWQAFFSVQLVRYLSGKHKRSFSTQAEHDMISDLVRDAWGDLRRSNGLGGKSYCEKLALFRSIWIVFPSVVLREPHINSPVIAVDFHKKAKIGLSERCLCGSGLPYVMCCGRTPGKEELLSGVF